MKKKLSKSFDFFSYLQNKKKQRFQKIGTLYTIMRI